MNTLQAQLSAILNSSNGERTIHRFLKENRDLVTMAFNRAWNYHTCIPEFQLGSEFRSDFVILSAHSVHWHAIFIELKDYKAKLYSKDGNPTKPLRQAQRQISDWREWIRVNEPYLRQRLALILEKDDALPIWPYDIPNYRKGYTSGAAEIADIKNYVEYGFHIVIGRSSSLTPEEREYRHKDCSWGRPEVATYDRLLTMARRVDEAESRRRGRHEK